MSSMQFSVRLHMVLRPSHRDFVTSDRPTEMNFCWGVGEILHVATLDIRGLWNKAIACRCMVVSVFCSLAGSLLVDCLYTWSHCGKKTTMGPMNARRGWVSRQRRWTTYQLTPQCSHIFIDRVHIVCCSWLSVDMKVVQSTTSFSLGRKLWDNNLDIQIQMAQVLLQQNFINLLVLMIVV